MLTLELIRSRPRAFEVSWPSRHLPLLVTTKCELEPGQSLPTLSRHMHPTACGNPPSFLVFVHSYEVTYWPRINEHSCCNAINTYFQHWFFKTSCIACFSLIPCNCKCKSAVLLTRRCVLIAHKVSIVRLTSIRTPPSLIRFTSSCVIITLSWQHLWFWPKIIISLYLYTVNFTQLYTSKIPTNVKIKTM